MDKYIDDAQIEHLLKAVEMPQVPKLGSPIKWFVFVLSCLMVVIAGGIAIDTEDIAVVFFGGIVSLVGAIGFLIETYGIFVKFSQEKKEYRWACEDFPSYQKMMAKRLYKSMKTKEEYSEDLSKTYGKQKTHYLGNARCGSRPSGKIRP